MAYSSDYAFSITFDKLLKFTLIFLYFHCCNLLNALAGHAVKGNFQKNGTFYIRKEEEKSALKGPRIIR